ncbi:hypothetical protein GCM10010171_04720 [Actinokineospora fastidiosa]|uniref:DUF2530 domain-containing protein n=2 Tax=Pseudonocardiaceae TaxID=2070 RepID=A0A918G3S3_9PSEU|nr:hypothetical protein Actkin_00494 [Actinokineospora sp. UTMC 2448]GGS15684.1 hypothetical protein GCM10010171_04720 [Actinokineospora fastidiosa]
MIAAVALFTVGLLAVIAIFVLGALDRQASWLWAVSMALPIGLGVAVAHIVRANAARRGTRSGR